MPVDFKVSGLYFGSILTGGPLAMLVVDPLTGGMWTVRGSAKNICRLLTREGVALKVQDIRNLTEEQRRQLVKLN